jgi:predicted amidohydrolase YtcJ
MLVIRNVRPWGGAATDVAIFDGMVSAIGKGLPRGATEIEGKGDLLLPGLHDHHLHILALAARKRSVDLAGLIREDDVCGALRLAPPGLWVRAVDYDERAAGVPDKHILDRWVADRPLRLADRTGALRVLNSAALAMISDRQWPPGCERDARGEPTGRFWREDQWLASAFPSAPPELAELGGELASMGLTSLTDAGARNGPAEAALLAGALPQRLVMMGSEELEAGEGYTLGPLKLLLDEREPPEPDALANRIRWARRAGRAVAAHCVTDGELALYLAALQLAGGARTGDRIEHGGMIPAAFVPTIAEAELTVVTNPAFLHDRGDRYRATIAQDRWPELYPAAGLARAGIALFAGSDAPYANVDPWLGMRSARDRLTAAGEVISPGERLTAIAAMQLYCSGKIASGAPADLMLCKGELADVLRDLTADRVALTMSQGQVIFAAD